MITPASFAFFPIVSWLFFSTPWSFFSLTFFSTPWICPSLSYFPRPCSPLFLSLLSNYFVSFWHSLDVVLRNRPMLVLHLEVVSWTFSICHCRLRFLWRVANSGQDYLFFGLQGGYSISFKYKSNKAQHSMLPLYFMFSLIFYCIPNTLALSYCIFHTLTHPGAFPLSFSFSSYRLS